MTNDPILNLTIEEPVDRPFIVIDGERYDLSLPDDFSVQELRDLQRKWKTILTIDMGEAAITEKQSKQFTDYLNDLVRRSVVGGLPDTLINNPNFGRTQKWDIVYHFFIEGVKRNPMTSKIDLTSLLPLLASNGSTTLETLVNG